MAKTAKRNGRVVDPDLFCEVWSKAMVAAENDNVVPLRMARKLSVGQDETLQLLNNPINRMLFEIRARVPDGLFVPVSCRILALTKLFDRPELASMIDPEMGLRLVAVRAAAKARIDHDTQEFDFADYVVKLAQEVAEEEAAG
jgi:hypothetical protein